MTSPGNGDVVSGFSATSITPPSSVFVPTNDNTASTLNSGSASIIPRALMNTTQMRELAEAMTDPPDPGSVTRRWGIIAAYNGPPDYTVDVTIGGVLVQGLAYDSAYLPKVGEVVMMDVVGTDTVVIGTTAPAYFAQTFDRTGVVTAWSGYTVDIAFNDITPAQAISGARFLSSYVPSVGDQVHVIQTQTTGASGGYLVTGSIGRGPRRPTGDLEMTLLPSAKPNTLLCQGQTLSRTTYSSLWFWVNVNQLHGLGRPFGDGDGSTTFTLPNLSGRTPIGAGTLGTDTYNTGDLLGSARVTLATNQMPAHQHAPTATATSTTTETAHGHGITDNGHYHTWGAGTDNQGSHFHAGNTGGMNANASHGHLIPTTWTTSTGHSHAGLPGTVSEAPNPNNGAGTSPGVTSTNTDHGHSLTTSTDGSHSHSVSGLTSNTGAALSIQAASPTASTTTTVTVSEATIGGSTPIDVRQPAFVVNWLIYV